MPPTRLALAIPLLAFAALTAAAQQPNPAQPAQDFVPTLHVTTRIVALDVVVTDGHGHPSTNLKPSDLTLTEDGVPQTILSFVEHDATAAPLPATTPDSQLPPNTFAVQQPVLGNGAVTVIVIGNVKWEHDPFVRDQIKAFVATAPIATPIAIIRGNQLIQGLTLDRRVLIEATNSQRFLPPLGGPPIHFLHLLGPPAFTLARYLAQIPGRINLVWFGEGQAPAQDEGLFPDMSSSTPQDLAAFIQTEGDAANVHRLSRIAFYPILAEGLVPPTPCTDQHCVATVAYSQALNALPCLDTRRLALSAGGEAFCDTNGFKEALTQVVTTGSHYYTVSYRPDNPNWDGKFRNIKIKIANEPPKSGLDKTDQWITSGPAFLQPRLAYRDGYFARDTPTAPVADPSAPLPTVASGNPSDATPTAPHRTLISLSPRGQATLAKTRMELAMGFGTLTPTQVHFTIVVTPSAESERLKPGEPLPLNNFLTGAFHDFAYRNCKIHYWIEPQDLHFTPTASGAYEDQLQFVAMVYNDGGHIANSIAYTGTIQIAADQIQDIQANGFTFDQTIAVTVPANPGPGNFFLRAGVNELATGHIGALEIPVEWIKPTPPVAQ